MKFADMLTADPSELAEHYRSVRNLAYNASRIAQHGRRSAAKVARSMGYLMRQIEMVERAADRRGISLAAEPSPNLAA